MRSLEKYEIISLFEIRGVLSLATDCAHPFYDLVEWKHTRTQGSPFPSLRPFLRNYFFFTTFRIYNRHFANFQCQSHSPNWFWNCYMRTFHVCRGMLTVKRQNYRVRRERFIWHIKYHAWDANCDIFREWPWRREMLIKNNQEFYSFVVFRRTCESGCYLIINSWADNHALFISQGWIKIDSTSVLVSPGKRQGDSMWCDPMMPLYFWEGYRQGNKMTLVPMSIIIFI